MQPTGDPSIDALQAWNHASQRLRRFVLIPGGVLALALTLASGSKLLLDGEVRRITFILAIGVPFVLVVAITWGVYQLALAILRKRFLAALPARYGLEGAQADDLRPFLH